MAVWQNETGKSLRSNVNLMKVTMNPQPLFDRRRFLGSAAAVTVGGLLSPGISELHAAPEGENDHFWYRLAPKGPYIDSQREHKVFGFGDARVFLSEDNGKTWAHSAAFADAENIGFSYILKNGNILFAHARETVS